MSSTSTSALRSTRRVIHLSHPNLAFIKPRIQPTLKASARWVHNSPLAQRSNYSGFIAVALGITGVAISYSVWREPIFPTSVKHPLRQALRAEQRGEIESADTAFKLAYQAAMLEESKTDWLKRSGIGIRWGSMWEKLRELEKARKVYEKVYQDLRQAGHLTPPERMRAVAVAQRLAVLSSEEEEAYLTWSVEEVLRLTLPSKTSHDHSSIVMGELELPEWATGADVGPCLEALGDFYARKGQPQYSVPLYLQALSLLLPPPPRRVQPSIPDRCHAATLMNNIANLLIHPGHEAPSVSDATSWATRGLAVAKAALAMDPTGDEGRECVVVQLVAQQNLGTLAEMAGDQAKARAWFGEARDEAQNLGILVAADRARDNLLRLDNDPPKPKS